MANNDVPRGGVPREWFTPQQLLWVDHYVDQYLNPQGPLYRPQFANVNPAALTQQTLNQLWRETGVIVNGVHQLNNNSTGSQGARGLGQITDRTARDFISGYGGSLNRMDPQDAIRAMVGLQLDFGTGGYAGHPGSEAFDHLRSGTAYITGQGGWNQFMDPTRGLHGGGDWADMGNIREDLQQQARLYASHVIRGVIDENDVPLQLRFGLQLPDGPMDTAQREAIWADPRLQNLLVGRRGAGTRNEVTAEDVQRFEVEQQGIAFAREIGLGELTAGPDGLIRSDGRISMPWLEGRVSPEVGAILQYAGVMPSNLQFNAATGNWDPTGQAASATGPWSGPEVQNWVAEHQAQYQASPSLQSILQGLNYNTSGQHGEWVQSPRDPGITVWDASPDPGIQTWDASPDPGIQVWDASDRGIQTWDASPIWTPAGGTWGTPGVVSPFAGYTEQQQGGGQGMIFNPATMNWGTFSGGSPATQVEDYNRWYDAVISGVADPPTGFNPVGPQEASWGNDIARIYGDIDSGLPGFGAALNPVFAGMYYSHIPTQTAIQQQHNQVALDQAIRHQNIPGFTQNQYGNYVPNNINFTQPGYGWVTGYSWAPDLSATGTIMHMGQMAGGQMAGMDTASTGGSHDQPPTEEQPPVEEQAMPMGRAQYHPGGGPPGWSNSPGGWPQAARQPRDAIAALMARNFGGGPGIGGPPATGQPIDPGTGQPFPGNVDPIQPGFGSIGGGGGGLTMPPSGAVDPIQPGFGSLAPGGGIGGNDMSFGGPPVSTVPGPAPPWPSAPIDMPGGDFRPGAPPGPMPMPGADLSGGTSGAPPPSTGVGGMGGVASGTPPIPPMGSMQPMPPGGQDPRMAQALAMGLDPAFLRQFGGGM